MARPGAIVAAVKSIPGGARNTPAPQGSGWGKVSPLAAELMTGSNQYANSYGPFLPRPSRTFTDGAFSPMSPIQPVPVDNPPPGGMFADPRLWPYRTGWNLPTPPGTEGLKLASFDQLDILSRKYSVARQCIELRKDEVLGLEWEIGLTTDAAKAYQGDHKAMRDFGERKALATKFFKHPDPDFWNFSSWLEAILEEIFVYDALSLVFRPKYGAGLGRGLLGSDLDHIKLVSGPTIRPLIGMHGEHPRPPSPAYQQYLYGVPRSDYMTLAMGTDIDDYGLAGSEVNTFRSDVLLYAPLKPTRETPYGFPPVERALLPIISGLQKQEFQLDYFTEGTVPAVYISPGDPNITPTQIKELQDALNAIAGDPAYHMKVVVLPPGSKVEPQRPVDLSDSFDELVMNQVCMAFDVQPTELGIIPAIGGGQQGPSASAIRMDAQASRDMKQRKSTKPMLMFLCDIFNYVLQDMCGQADMQFAFEGLVDDEDKQAITQLGVEQVQNGISSIDEVRERLDLAPWGLTETSEPVVFTAQGPIPFSMAPQLIMAMQQNANGGGGSASGGKGQKTSSTRSRTKQPTVRQGGQTKPNGSHPSPVAGGKPARSTPGHAAASGAIQGSTPGTGGTTHRSSVAGSRKKAVSAELDALKRHLHKGRLITTWEARNVDDRILGLVAEDIAKGILIDTAVDRAEDLALKDETEWIPDEPAIRAIGSQWPGWEKDLSLVGTYKERLTDSFHSAEVNAQKLRKEAATGVMSVSASTLRGLISDDMRETFLATLNPMWAEAWSLGYASAKSLVSGQPADFTVKHEGEHLQGFLDTEGEHWLQQISRTGLGNSVVRSEVIARTEIARAVNTAALQCYRDNGISYKHLLLAPDDSCDQCKGASADGIIPLDASFSAGGMLGFVHPQCRCAPAPAGIDVEPPQGHLGKSETEDESRASFILIRARNDEGKWLYLLQKRAGDGTWGLPGGTSHVGESPWQTAVREVSEEIGAFPVVPPKVTLTRQEKDRMVHVFLCELPAIFHPTLDGDTADETEGYGWFRKGEVKDLDLQSNFKKQWKDIDWSEIAKALAVNENGEVSSTDRGPGKPHPVGSNWPFPHRADGTEEPWPDAGPGAVPGSSAGNEPPAWEVQGTPVNDWSDARNSLLYPLASEDAQFPRQRGRGGQGPQADFPKPGNGQHPSGGIGSAQPAGSTVGGDTGSKAHRGKPVVGMVPPHAPQPVAPMSVEPEAFDPADTVEHWSPEDESNTIVNLPGKKKPVRKDAANLTDPNPVEATHVLNMMESNFPDPAIDWVRRASWIGPVQIPWDRINDHNIDSWAASHQPARVNEFARRLRSKTDKVNPSILIQRPDDDKCDIVDGHHRALAHKKLGEPVLAYVGTVHNKKDTQAALETHAMQYHAGSDPQNK